ncbi:hypothetical protein GH714_034324 [Hevea brasiliensis]|uniref:MTTase N-terminal domain-containing protein n=1 Tax=Hevea brasiliensis TaxID=3981 RepID=A0A6A6MF88_HEVBR|nr:hypothetical protein GH714_034324 [Hevea brasiliensis]
MSCSALLHHHDGFWNQRVKSCSLYYAIAFGLVPAAEVSPESEIHPRGRIYHETYGCQMNINDMEIVLSIMKDAGYSEVVDVPEHAEIIFINTCAIRDNAEHKVWQRLNYFWFLKRHWKEQRCYWKVTVT